MKKNSIMKIMHTSRQKNDIPIGLEQTNFTQIFPAALSRTRRSSAYLKA